MQTIVTIEGFSVMGIEARTNNTLEIEGRGVIPELWSRFPQEAGRIPSRLDATMIALYTGYESDEHGDYTFFIGAKVPAATPPPAGMVLREVPAGRYAVLTSARGPLERVVPELWQKVWQGSWRESQTPPLVRAFRTDFELYDTRAANPHDGVIDVYIGLKYPEI